MIEHSTSAPEITRTAGADIPTLVVPATMDAVAIDHYGGAEELHLRRMFTPKPGWGHVLIRVRAVAINPADWKVRNGILRMMWRPQMPLVLGFDIVGEIVEVGPGAYGWNVGDAVMANTFPLPFVEKIRGGGYAEFAVIDATQLVQMPNGMPFEEAAALPSSGITALQALRDVAGVKPGQRVLINGASGGVGILAVQLAAEFGAEVTAVASGRHAELLTELGAAHTIDYQRDDFTQGQERYDVVFDVAGNRSFSECSRVLAGSGRYVTAVPGPTVLLGVMLSRLRSLIGTTPRCHTLNAKPNQRDLQFLVKLVHAGRLRVHVGQTFTLGQIREAHELSESGHPGGGKLVVRVAPDNEPRRGREGKLVAPSLPSDRHPKAVHGVIVEHFTDAPLQVVKRIDITRTPAEVFAEYSDFERISEWMPMIKAVRTDHSRSASGPSECGVGTQCHLDLGTRQMVETIIHWDPPRAYAYHVEDPNMRGHLGIFACEASEHGETTVTWRQYYHPPGRARILMFRGIQRWILGRGLKNLKARLERAT